MCVVDSVLPVCKPSNGAVPAVDPHATFTGTGRVKDVQGSLALLFKLLGGNF